MAAQPEILSKHVGGRWLPPLTTTFVDVHNPARGDVIARVPLSTVRGIDAGGAAVTTGAAGPCPGPSWPLEEEVEWIAHLVATEHGRALDRSRGSWWF